ncbi:hypothetical protein YC2023_075038 [Brassica napus]
MPDLGKLLTIITTYTSFPVILRRTHARSPGVRRNAKRLVNGPRETRTLDGEASIVGVDQNQHDEIEAKFFEESQRAALEAKYQKLYQPFYTKIPEMKVLLSILRISSGTALKNQKVLSRTEIEWFPGKCLTRRILKKKPNKGSKNTKPITKTEDCESFFTFLSPPQVSDDEEDLDDDMVWTPPNESNLETSLEPSCVWYPLDIFLSRNMICFLTFEQMEQLKSIRQ